MAPASKSNWLGAGEEGEAAEFAEEKEVRGSTVWDDGGDGREKGISSNSSLMGFPLSTRQASSGEGAGVSRA